MSLSCMGASSLQMGEPAGGRNRPVAAKLIDRRHIRCLCLLDSEGAGVHPQGGRGRGVVHEAAEASINRSVDHSVGMVSVTRPVQGRRRSRGNCGFQETSAGR